MCSGSNIREAPMTAVILIFERLTAVTVVAVVVAMPVVVVTAVG